jgi:hypothetical protein
MEMASWETWLYVLGSNTSYLNPCYALLQGSSSWSKSPESNFLVAWPGYMV